MLQATFHTHKKSIRKFLLLSIFFLTIIVGAFFFIQQTVAGSWSQRGFSSAWVSVASDSDGTKLAAVTENQGCGIYLSDNSGNSWYASNWSGTECGNTLFKKITSSTDGNYLYAIGNSNDGSQYIFSSHNRGNGVHYISNLGSSGSYTSDIDVSDNGSSIIAVLPSGNVVFSSSAGASWGLLSFVGDGRVAMSGDGSVYFIVGGDGTIYKGSGGSFTGTGGSLGAPGKGIAVSSDGMKILAAGSGVYLLRSIDGGNSWTQLISSGQRNWTAVSSSDNGTKLAAITQNGDIYTSTDSGQNWSAQGLPGTYWWSDIDGSANGGVLIAADASGYLYTGTNDESTPPTIASVSSDKPDGTYTVGETIDIDVTFSEEVTSSSVTVTLDTGRTCTFSISNATTGTCDYIVQSGDFSNDLTVSSISGTIQDQSANTMSDFSIPTPLSSVKDILIRGTPGCTSGSASNYNPSADYDDGSCYFNPGCTDSGANNYNPSADYNDGSCTYDDTTPPTVNSVTSDTSNGTYAAGASIDIDVIFSEPVISSGDITLMLDTGGTCAFSLSSYADNGTCTYTVQSGEFSNDLTVSSISGTIQDQSANTMSDFSISSNLNQTKDIGVDAFAPYITSIYAATNGVFYEGNTINVYINFSEAVTSSTEVYLTFNNGGTCSLGAISNSASASCDYTVQSGEFVGDLDVSSVTTSGSVIDGNSNVMSSFSIETNLAQNNDISIESTPDTTPPVISSINSSVSNGTYGINSVIRIIVSFSETVTAIGDIILNLDTGSVEERTCVISNDSTFSDGECDYTVQMGDFISSLNVLSVAGSIFDLANNQMSDFSIPSGNNLADSKTITLDDSLDVTAPTIVSVSSDKSDGTYTVGEVIDIDVTFSESVTSTGDVTVILETGDIDRECSFSIDNSNTGTCDYTVQAGDSTADLDIISISGTIQDQAGNDLSDFTIPSNLSANKNIVIDAIAPTIVSVSSLKPDGTYTVDELIDIDVTFSENVTSIGSITVTFDTGRTCMLTPANNITATCTYTVQSGDSSGDLNVNSISGTIQDQAGNDLSDFTIPSNLSANKDIQIRGTLGCTDSGADNYNPSADYDDGSCTYTVSGCTDSAANNYNPSANTDDGSCTYTVPGCTDSGAENYNPSATEDDGSCEFAPEQTDSTPPVRSAGSPSTEQPAGTTGVTLSLTTDEAATCRYSTTPGTAYASITNTMSTTGGTSHSQAITGLSDNTTYTYYVRCVDANTNANTDDYTITFNVAQNPGALGGGRSGGGGSSQSYRRDATTDTTGDTRVSTTTATTTTTTPADTTTPDITTTITRVDTILTTIRSLLADPTPDVVTLTELIAELKTIFATLETNTPTDTTPTTTTFTTDLSLGMNHPDVQLLQQFLNRTSFIVASQGAGSVGRETTFFGYATEAALIQFQRFYNITPAIGFFGAVTRGVVNGMMQ